MKNAHLGSLEVSRIGLGAMTMAGTYTSEGALDNAESIRTIHRALDLGVTHIDTAEIYGPFLSEEIVGQAIKGRRDQVMIATKFGLVSHSGGGPGVIDSSAANVKAAVEGSLKRLGTDHIDLLLPAPRRPEHPDRGDRRRRRRPDRRGQGAALRALRGLPGDHPPRTRRAAGLRAADRVLAVDPRRGGRDPAAAARARHRLRPVLAARPRPAHRPDPLRRRLRRRRLAQDQPPLHRRELPPQPRDRRRGAGHRRRDRRDPRADRARVAPHPRRSTSPRSPAPAGSPGSRRTPRPTASNSPATSSIGSNALRPAAGERHDEANMASIDR